MDELAENFFDKLLDIIIEAFEKMVDSVYRSETETGNVVDKDVLRLEMWDELNISFRRQMEDKVNKT